MIINDVDDVDDGDDDDGDDYDILLVTDALQNISHVGTLLFNPTLK
jgi:hypothetical protein